MNYQKIYENIILNAKKENRVKNIEICYENHHILPKCLNGSEKKENKILLTPREHFVCHKLLLYIYPNNNKIKYAFYMMATIKKKKSIYKVSSREYDDARKQIKIILSSEEVKQKRANTIYNKKYSLRAIEKYIDDLKETHYSSSEDPIIHISFKNKEYNKINNKQLKDNIKKLNNKGCYIPIIFDKTIHIPFKK
jgi:hypothetical protein